MSSDCPPPRPTERPRKSIVGVVGCLIALLFLSALPALLFLVEGSFYPLSLAECAWVGAGACIIAVAHRIHRAYAKGKVGLTAFVLVAVAIVLVVAYRVRPLPFDAEVWRRAAQTHDGDTQQRMLPSLCRMLARREIASKARAVELLGAPWTTHTRDKGSSELLKWDLGPARGLLAGIDSCYLWLAFGQEGKLIGHGVSYYD